MFGVDEVDAEPGELCPYCKNIMVKKFVPYCQVGDATEITYLQPLCPECKAEKWGEIEEE